MTGSRLLIRTARPGDAAGIARVETETWRDAYPTLLPKEYLVRKVGNLPRWRSRLRDRPGNVLVAEAAPHRIVGYATWGPLDRQRPRSARSHWQLYELYVLLDHREQGIGRRLCGEIARRLIGQGIRSLHVEVLEGNPSRYFYEALGARLVAQSHHEFAGRELPVAVYVWDDLEALTASGTA